MRQIVLTMSPLVFAKFVAKQRFFVMEKSYPKEADADNLAIKVLIYCEPTEGLSVAQRAEIQSYVAGAIDYWEGKIAARFILQKVYVSKYVDGICGQWTLNECPHHTGVDLVDFEKITGISRDEAETYAGPHDFYFWDASGFELLDKSQEKKLSDFGLTKAPRTWCYIKDEANGND